MGMSATQLGALFGRGGAAMNMLLHEHGFIEGGPGAWSLTKLGEQFAKLVDKDNGYGGYAHRAWSWLTWDNDVVDALKASIKAHPEGVLPVVPTPVTASSVAAGVKKAAANSSSGAGKGKWIVLGLLGAAAVAAPVFKHLRGSKEPTLPEPEARPATRGPEDLEATEATGTTDVGASDTGT